MPRINVRTLTGTNHEVDIDVTCTVQQLKAKIERLNSGLLVSRQLLMLEEEELADSDTLDTYGIVEGETIHLTILALGTRVTVNFPSGRPEVWYFPEGDDTPLIHLWDKIEAKMGGSDFQLTYNPNTAATKILPSKQDAAGKTFSDFGIRSGQGEISVIARLHGGA